MSRLRHRKARLWLPRLLGATAAGPAPAEEPDETALVQTSATTRRARGARELAAAASGAALADLRDFTALGPAGPAPGAAAVDCSCLSWTEAYASGVQCGQGLEGGSSEMCEGFFARMGNNYCASIVQGWAPGSWQGGTWCFVSSGCIELNGGRPVTQAVSWKVCQAGADISLRGMHPLNLYALSKAQNLDLGILTKMAYPVFNKLWSETGSREKVVAGSRTPVVFDTQSDHHGDKILVENGRVWTVKFNQDILAAYADRHRLSWADAPLGSFYTLVCDTGCDPGMM